VSAWSAASLVVAHAQPRIPAKPVASRRVPLPSCIVVGTRTTATDELSPAEIRVLRLISEGESNKEIAATLGLSVDTVKGQVKSILSKLDASDRTQAAMIRDQARDHRAVAAHRRWRGRRSWYSACRWARPTHPSARGAVRAAGERPGRACSSTRRVWSANGNQPPMASCLPLAAKRS
jgi:DNA-binding CsgD family transcriptional regulator